ncbi:MAG: adenylate/guanylate cyclase domain-containing protein [Sterolibacterium sp.]|nr:adenylate/guanylate cyclase domain-containing protein [Sterolibacterium sp.]
MNSATLPAESLATRAARNFFTHSGHVPLVMLILEALLAKPGYFAEPDPYLLLAAGVFQAVMMELPAARRRFRPFLANLAGPLLYSLVEAGLEGLDFFRQWHHQAYWGFALGFALLQWAQGQRSRVTAPLVLAENVLRSAIPLVMYALFEARSKNAMFSLDVFLNDRAHVFLCIVLLLLGVLLGFADINLRRSLATVRSLTLRLRQYSEWSLGRGILDRAIADERTLLLQRVERAVLFIDIRGFTAWSEQQTPEAVVGMLNEYYRTAEEALGETHPIKLKYTADEVMAVFADAPQAVQAGRRMLAGTRPLLAASNLDAGAGVHCGQVVEGILGGEGAKAYDFIGDTVNTAQRLCDAAAPGELLVSIAACGAAGLTPMQFRDVAAKGKREPVRAAAFT